MGYSIQKEMILNVLHSSRQHRSVEEIHKELTKIIPAVSLMTVYRNLNKLVKDGSVFPFHVGNVQHFCGNPESHFHLLCVDCGTIEDGHDRKISNMLKQIKLNDFSILPNGMIIKGLCNNCNPNNKIHNKQDVYICNRSG